MNGVAQKKREGGGSGEEFRGHDRVGQMVQVLSSACRKNFKEEYLKPMK